jgi:hypothetical protein
MGPSPWEFLDIRFLSGHGFGRGTKTGAQRLCFRGAVPASFSFSISGQTVSMIASFGLASQEHSVPDRSKPALRRIQSA